MQRSSEDRILTTITGSLPRPADLAELLLQRQDGEPAFEARLTEAVAETVAHEVEAGLAVVSDGEMSKADYVDYISERMDGFGDAVPSSTDSFYFGDLVELPELVQAIWGDVAFKFRVCEGDVAYTDRGRELVARDIANFKAALAASGATEGFMPAASPGVIAMTFPNRHYPSYEQYVLAVGEALNAEYKAITDAGLIVQIDAPDVALCGDMHTWMRSEVEARGVRGVQELHVEAINVALRGIDSEQVRMHLCYANYMGPHRHDLPIEQALEPAFRANVCGYNFEAANPAHAHEWRVFEELAIPDGKLIIPGIVDTKSQVVEHPELVAERIERYVRLVGPEKLIAGTDCGFGTAVGALQVHPKVGWMKIGTLVEGAALASRRLARA